MDFMEVVKLRRSVRRYKPDPVPVNLLNNVLKAARLAPSAGNRQPWHFIVVKDHERKRMLGIPPWASEAPVVIVGCTEAAGQTDIAIAFEHLVLAAANFGLGTCWIGLWGADDRVKDILEAPGNIRVLAATPLGYPAESPPAKPRKPLPQIVHNERF